MITLTLVEQVKKGSRLDTKRYMKLYHSMDKARKEIVPIENIDEIPKEVFELYAEPSV